MSIADKLITIAENEQKVYHAGQIKTLADTKSLNGTLSGDRVFANDVADIKHKVTCQLTSDTVTDFSLVKVSRYGKNVFNYNNAIVQMDNGSFKRIENGFYVLGVDGGKETGAVYSNGKIFITPRGLPIAPKYTISMDYEILSEQRPEMNRISLQTENYQQHFLEVSVGDKGRMSITVSLFNRMSVCVGGHGVNLTNIQVEIGDTATNYEPYKASQTVTANADGTVDGITSVAPNMTLLTDTNGVIINANYYKDADIVISNIAQNIALSGGEG